MRESERVAKNSSSQPSSPASGGSASSESILYTIAAVLVFLAIAIYSLYGKAH
jgi:hypothetical protein